MTLGTGPLADPLIRDCCPVPRPSVREFELVYAFLDPLVDAGEAGDAGLHRAFMYFVSRCLEGRDLFRLDTKSFGDRRERVAVRLLHLAPLDPRDGLRRDTGKVVTAEPALKAQSSK